MDYLDTEHRPDGRCCIHAALTLGQNLYQRARNRPYYMTDDYAAKLGKHDGQTVLAVHTFRGPGGIASYTIQFPNGTYGHLPSLYAEYITTPEETQ